MNYPTPSNPVKFFYTRDHLGSIREVTDSTGTVVARYDYDAWGKQVATLGNITASDFGYTGHRALVTGTGADIIKWTF